MTMKISLTQKEIEKILKEAFKSKEVHLEAKTIECGYGMATYTDNVITAEIVMDGEAYESEALSRLRSLY